MSLSKKEDGPGKKMSILNKAATLNPFAVEFIPSAQKSSSIAAKALNIETTTAESFAESGVSASSCSDEEDSDGRCNFSLPDKFITREFDVADEGAALAPEPLSLLSSSSPHTCQEDGKVPSGRSLQCWPRQHVQESLGGGGAVQCLPLCRDYFSPEKCLNLPNDPWDEQDLALRTLSSMGIMVNDRLGESKIDGGADSNPVEFLASQFPGFAAESLAEVYFASGSDLGLTIDMLTQLELQVDLNTNDENTPRGPSLTVMDFPALPAAEKQNAPSLSVGDDSQKSDAVNAYHKCKTLLFNGSSSLPPQKAGDFAAAVKKLASQDSHFCKFGKNNSSSCSSAAAGASSSDNGCLRGATASVDRLRNTDSSSWTAPIWLETGDAVADMYAAARGEARDHARLRNACFQQATQAYLVGNKALAKELSVKGKRHNTQMKEAHAKAQESIYRWRNPLGADGKKHGRGSGQMIDLHGLHVSEALCVLKHELDALRKISRASDQHFPVYVCVGTGHHTKGSCTPARLPISVHRYLLEHEHLHCFEPQPGLFRVVI